jgi:DNA polymerase III subunit delta
VNQTHLQILNDLKAGKVKPLYLLEGEETFFIDEVNEFFEHQLLSEAQRSFNLTILYGKDTSAMDIRQRAVNLPMFASQQVIIVKEAQLIKKWDDLLPYFSKPVPATILIIEHKYDNFDKRTKAYKAIQDSGVVMTAKRLKEIELIPWIAEYVSAHHLKIIEDAQRLLADYVGNDLCRISGELDKIFINKKNGEIITRLDVETQVVMSREFNVFELCKALAHHDVQKVYRITDYLVRNKKGNPFVLTLGALFGYFQKYFIFLQQKNLKDEDFPRLKLWPALISEYQSAKKFYNPEKTQSMLRTMHNFDLRSKGVNNSGTDEGALLKELIFQILH